MIAVLQFLGVFIPTFLGTTALIFIGVFLGERYSEHITVWLDYFGNWARNVGRKP